MPSSDKDILPDSTLQHFLEKVPILQIVGTTLLVDATYKYKIDEEAQLVCKYLQALKSGCIDNLYEEGQEHMPTDDAVCIYRFDHGKYAR